MINPTETLNAVKPVSRVAKWKVCRIVNENEDEDDASFTPRLVVQVRLYGVGNSPWPNNPFTMVFSDTKACSIMITNPEPRGLADQFLRTTVTLPGAPYSTLVAAMNAVTGEVARNRAVEMLLPVDPIWKIGVAYKAGAKSAHSGLVYRCTSDVTGGDGPTVDLAHWETAAPSIGAMPAEFAGV